MDVNFVLDEMEDAAKQLLETAGDRTVIAFYGEMGAGKTTLIHAICDVLNVKGTVSSPTFSIVNEYATVTGATIYHMDLYRLKNAAEAIEAGVEDCLYSGDLCLVEWPEKAPELLPAATVHCYLTVAGNNARKLQIKL